MDEWEGRLRVAMYTNVYLPNMNGVVVSVETFRKALTKLGHHVYIFGPDSGDIEERSPYVFRYPSLELPLQKYPLTLPVNPYADRILRNLKPQVLHANHPALLGRVAERKSEELDLPLVFTYHTRYADYSHYAGPLPQENVKDFIHQWLGSYMTKCHHVVVPSESIATMLQTTYGIERHVSVVPTGIDIDRFTRHSREESRRTLAWDPDETVLISVGRLAKEKSFDLLLEAFARLQGPPRRLVLLGHGEEQPQLEALAQTLGVADRVQFTGGVPFEEVPVYLTAADLFVFASVTETQGLVTLEAMACGLPVVAVEASGTREAVDPEFSILTEQNADALARGVEEMLARPDLPLAGAKARKRAAQFGLLAQGEAMVEVYLRAQEAHRHREKVLVPTADPSLWQQFLDRFRL